MGLKKIKKLLAILLSTIFFTSAITSVSAATFTDVPENHPYKDAVEFSRAKGFVAGTGVSTFSPDAKVSRAQFAFIWCRSLNIIEDNHPYSDITKLRNYYDSSVVILRGLGILSGTSTTRFSPSGYLTREQLALITMKTYNLGVADDDAYKAYADSAAISDWAQDGVSACINAKVLEGLYDGESFKPGEHVTRAELCKLIYNISVPAYTITIAPLEGGTVEALPSKARPGTVITLTVAPEAGKQLKAGSLKYNGTAVTGNTFIMPAENVTITAEFEDKPTVLESISVTTPPAKTTYTAGEALDLAGMVVTANYSNNTNNVITEYTTVPDAGSTLDTQGTVTVTVSFTVGDVTKTTTFTVQVNPAG
ncbi:endo-1,4-beta-xylanase A precursor [Ruminiclostridium hungatei]|uniref:Endo-1,4-beta-xylanase A n=1 Tax=Ruminiclostridium hungatei TaxID=48256 RepID=A0A1V4SIJ4_RUMHU|nr:S-layer homology domain-containing protein [Ruminiclostridium hungatei]OPX43326.1 endo-1,4-beta-xylanase A precursor [Ruminiclostridium hungatei]